MSLLLQRCQFSKKVAAIFEKYGGKKGVYLIILQTQ